jgi:hypothetical protein
MHKLKVVPRVTVRGMRVPKSVGDVKDFPIFLWYFYDVWGEFARSHLPSHSCHATRYVGVLLVGDGMVIVLKNCGM